MPAIRYANARIGNGDENLQTEKQPLVKTSLQEEAKFVSEARIREINFGF